jgi:hypothetical protein
LHGVFVRDTHNSSDMGPRQIPRTLCAEFRFLESQIKLSVFPQTALWRRRRYQALLRYPYKRNQ